MLMLARPQRNQAGEADPAAAGEDLWTTRDITPNHEPPSTSRRNIHTTADHCLSLIHPQTHTTADHLPTPLLTIGQYQTQPTATFTPLLAIISHFPRATQDLIVLLHRACARLSRMWMAVHGWVRHCELGWVWRVYGVS